MHKSQTTVTNNQSGTAMFPPVGCYSVQELFARRQAAAVGPDRPLEQVPLVRGERPPAVPVVDEPGQLAGLGTLGQVGQQRGDTAGRYAVEEEVVLHQAFLMRAT